MTSDLEKWGEIIAQQSPMHPDHYQWGWDERWDETIVLEGGDEPIFRVALQVDPGAGRDMQVKTALIRVYLEGKRQGEASGRARLQWEFRGLLGVEECKDG